MILPDRAYAEKLLKTYVEDDYQKLHSRMVARGLEEYAKKYDAENTELWFQTGLLHDLDFNKWPENHPDIEKFKELTEEKYPQEFYDAIKSHNLEYNLPRNTLLAKALLAVDELAGLFYAVAKMRPDGFDMKSKSIKKKYKDKSFAAKINRDDINTGMEDMGITLDEHINFLIPVFKEFQGELN